MAIQHVPTEQEMKYPDIGHFVNRERRQFVNIRIENGSECLDIQVLDIVSGYDVLLPQKTSSPQV